MVARVRNQTFQRASGARWSNNTPGILIGDGLITTDYAYCGDHTGPTDCNPFYVDKRSTQGGVINKFTEGGFDSNFRDYICDAIRNTATFGHQPVFGIPSDVELATTGAARSNPSRPYVDVPVNILDLRTRIGQIRDDFRDIFRSVPRRFRTGQPRAGDILRESGSSYLNYQFLIRPLVGDIIKMAHAAEQVSRRVTQINDLFDGDGMRKTVHTGAWSDSGQYGYALQSSGQYIFSMMDWQTTVETRVFCKWAPEFRVEGIPHPPSYVRAWANRAVGGYTLDASTLWELTPWSWLIDWGSNVSEYLISQRNIVPAVLRAVCPMRHTHTVTTCPSISFDNGNMTALSIVQDTKERHVSFVSPIAHFPFLNAGQMGILGALAAART
jgi:hypothetical protein